MCIVDEPLKELVLKRKRVQSELSAEDLKTPEWQNVSKIRLRLQFERFLIADERAAVFRGPNDRGRPGDREISRHRATFPWHGFYLGEIDR